MQKKKRPLILISNDDGIQARGINVLTKVAIKYGDVLVVAPDGGRSGASHSVSLSSCIRLNKISEEENLCRYISTGTPADCIKLAVNQILDEKPDIILSGINHGSNSSVSVFYSGTMAAVIEGCMNGIPSVGFSVDDHSANADMSVAEEYVHEVIQNLLKSGLPKGACLNINFPSVSSDEIKGVKICRQTQGVWKEEFETRKDPYGNDYYWLTGEFNNNEPESRETDDWALKNNYIAVVPVSVDLTNHKAIPELKKWDFLINGTK
ncbi:5'/3'-nucleotidase SurE [Bacteroidota bacterium]